MIIKNFEINKKIKNLLSINIYLIYGENIGLKKDVRELIINAKSEKNEKAEVLSFYENDIVGDDKNFYNAIYSGSLFSKKKIITVNNGTDKIVKYIENLLNKNPENILLIIYSDILQKKSKLRNLFEINKNTICIPCYLDSERDLQNIIIGELKKNNISLSRESINLVIEKSNKDRNYLRNEIEKIKSYSLNKTKIDAEDIKHLINFSGEHKSDVLINECLCGNIFQYKKILSEFYTNTMNQMYLLRILSNKIQRLLNIKNMESDYPNLDGLLGAAKPPIFWKDKEIVKKQLKIWNVNNLKKIVLEINNTELLCKKNPQIAKTIFLNFFTKLCKTANSSS